jgi:hypothetical protein
MKTNLFRTLATLVALALLAPLGLVQAQEVQLASHAELNDLYARLAELESRVAASNVSGCGCADACGNGCGDCCDDCCGCPGFIAGAELLWLEPFATDGALAGMNLNEATRLWVGYQGAGGLGVRARLFDYQQTVPAGAFGAGNDLDIESIDFEIYDSFQLSYNWDLILGGGLRYMDYQQTIAGAGTIRHFGTGPVVTAELYRHVSDRAALFAIVRESILGGDEAIGGVPVIVNDTLVVSELQLGVQAHRDYNGGLLFARAAWEAQHYSDTFVTTDTTLIGFGFSVGLMR